MYSIGRDRQYSQGVGYQDEQVITALHRYMYFSLSIAVYSSLIKQKGHVIICTTPLKKLGIWIGLTIHVPSLILYKCCYFELTTAVNNDFMPVVTIQFK